MVRKSFSPSSSATWREEENAPASNAPNVVALRCVPAPWVVITWPLLSRSITEVAPVSFMSLFKAIEIIASSRSEIIRLVSCSMYASSSVYTFGIGHPLYVFCTLYSIECFKNFISGGFDHVAHTANARSIIKKGNHQGEVTQGIHAD